MRREHFDELEADFHEHYNLDVALVKTAKAARLMFQLPRSCRVFTVLHPAVQWGWGEVLTNKMVFLLETLVWMKTKDAQKKMPQNKPKFYVPDFMQAPPEESAINAGKEVHTTDDIRDILSRPRV